MTTMIRTVLGTGLLLSGIVGVMLAAWDWSVFAIGVGMLHVSVPATVAVYVLTRRPAPAVVPQLALGTGTGFAPTATVLWTFNLLGGGPSGGSALWIAYTISALASSVLIAVYSSAYGLLVDERTSPMIEGFGASAAPIPVGSVFAIASPETVAQAAVCVLAIGLPGSLLVLDHLGKTGHVPALFRDVAAPAVSLRQTGKSGVALLCAMAAGMGPFYAFNDPAWGLGGGLGLTGGLGLCAFTIALGAVPPAAFTHPSRVGHIQGGLAAGGIVLLLLSFALSGAP